MLKRMVFEVEGMTCSHCTKKISDSFCEVSEVEKIDFSLEKKEVLLEFTDLRPLELKKRIEDLGFNVRKMAKAKD